MICQQTASEAGRTDFNPSVRAPGRAGFNQSVQAFGEYEYCIIGPDHPRRAEIEGFIGERFAAVHDAHITSFMTQLIALTDGHGVIKSAIGVRDASNTRLFLEHYLDVPVEKAIASQADKYQQQAVRKQIVEVGNLASVDRNASRRLFEFLALHLIQSGYQWIVFTGCTSLRHIFKRMQLELISLGNADQMRLPRELGSWGRYYDNSPQVMAGLLSGGLTLALKACTGMPGARA